MKKTIGLLMSILMVFSMAVPFAQPTTAIALEMKTLHVAAAGFPASVTDKEGIRGGVYLDLMAYSGSFEVGESFNAATNIGELFSTNSDGTSDWDSFPALNITQFGKVVATVKVTGNGTAMTVTITASVDGRKSITGSSLFPNTLYAKDLVPDGSTEPITKTLTITAPGDVPSNTPITWNQGSTPAPTYGVTYAFESATQGEVLPAEVIALLPNDEAEYEEGEIVPVKQPTSTTVTTEDGTWTFKGYEGYTGTTTTMGTSALTISGNWEFTPNTYHVTYTAVSISPGVYIPAEVTAVMPKDTSAYRRGDTVTLQNPTATSITTGDGIWTFMGYNDPRSPITMGTEDIYCFAEWKFEPFTYGVTYEFESATEGEELPAEVTALLPTDSATYRNGATVTIKQPTNTTVTTEDGTWTFKGYEGYPGSTTTMGRSALTITGQWEFTPFTYGVTYAPVSASQGEEIPAEVIAAMPTDDATYRRGATVTIQQPTSTAVTTEDGTWTFKGYTGLQGNTTTMGTSPLTISGEWEFTPKTYGVTYEFESATEGEELPAGVTALLPTDDATYRNGATVTVQQPAETTVTAENGTWTFKGYTEYPDPTTTMGRENLTIAGKWELAYFTYAVSYSFTSDENSPELPEEVRNLLPQENTEHTHGTNVTPQDPAKTKVVVEGGTWTFNGWDTTSTVANGPITFAGTWTFEPTPDTPANPGPEVSPEVPATPSPNDSEGSAVQNGPKSSAKAVPAPTADKNQTKAVALPSTGDKDLPPAASLALIVLLGAAVFRLERKQ